MEEVRKNGQYVEATLCLSKKSEVIPAVFIQIV